MCPIFLLKYFLNNTTMNLTQYHLSWLNMFDLGATEHHWQICKVLTWSSITWINYLNTLVLWKPIDSESSQKGRGEPYISSHWTTLKIIFIRVCHSSILFNSGFLVLHLNIAIMFQSRWISHFPAVSAHNHSSFWASRQLHTVWQSNFGTEHFCSTNTVQQNKKGNKIWC